MKRNAAIAAVVLALLLTGIVNAQSRDDILNQNVLRLLAEKDWLYGAPPRHLDVPRAANEFNDDQEPPEYRDEDRNYYDYEIRAEPEKRSAVATALNAGRRRRQPTPALGKAVTPFVGVGIMSDMGSYFKTLGDNIKIIASQPAEKSFRLDPPAVVNAPANEGGGGSGMNKILSLRPIKPGFGSIRSYKRRSYPGVVYDPRPLWIGLGR